MSGYTDSSPSLQGPDYELIKQLVYQKIPVIAEGRIHTPEQLQKAYSLGITSAVIGGAITRPKEIAERFISALK